MSTISLFKNPFMPKKAPPRKATTISQLQMDAVERAREFALDYKTAHMMLGTQHFKFDTSNGEWFDGKLPDLYKKKNFKITIFKFLDDTGEYFYPPHRSSTGVASKKQDAQAARSKSKEVAKMQKTNQQLHEENNLLKVKNEILIDMMSEIWSEYKFEIDRSKNKK